MAGQEQIPLQVLERLVPFTSLADSHLEDIQRKGRMLSHGKGRILFKRGNPGGVLIYLLQGSVDLADADFEITPVSGGSDRARHPLDDHAPHALTAVTTSAVRVFVVPKDHVDLVLTWDQASGYLVSELSENEDVEESGDWMSSLLSSALFAAVPPANIQALFVRFEEVRRSAGDTVITQGEAGDYFYVIKSGRCRITRKVNQDGRVKEVPLAEIGVGDVFGEDALIGEAPRNATVTMITDGALMRLGQEDFEELLQNPVLEQIDFATYRSLAEDPGTRIELLDVRLPAEFEQARLEGSRNLPLYAIRENFGKLDPDTLYVLTCDGGRRSILASYLLSQEGLDARVLEDPPDLEWSAV